MKGAVRQTGEDGRRYAIWLTPAGFVTVASMGAEPDDTEYAHVPDVIFRGMVEQFLGRAERLAKLKATLQELGGPLQDTEAAHGDADDALVEYIDDKEVAKLYADVPKWYA